MDGFKLWYLESALAEALRQIDRDHGAEYVDRFIEGIFKTYNAEEAFLEAHDAAISPDADKEGRDAVLKALQRARSHR